MALYRIEVARTVWVRWKDLHVHLPRLSHQIQCEGEYLERNDQALRFFGHSELLEETAPRHLRAQPGATFLQYEFFNPNRFFTRVNVEKKVRTCCSSPRSGLVSELGWLEKVGNGHLLLRNWLHYQIEK